MILTCVWPSLYPTSGLFHTVIIKDVMSSLLLCAYSLHILCRIFFQPHNACSHYAPYAALQTIVIFILLEQQVLELKKATFMS